MPNPVPTPVAAAIGLVPTVIEGVRRLPAKAVQLPVLTVSFALTALDTARREYDDLAERGERLIAQLLGSDGEDALQNVVVPLAEAPKGEPTPKATEPSTNRVDTAANPEVVEVVEEVVQSLQQASAPTVPSRDELPLADYDHMTLGSLRGRLRSLAVPELVQVREYEKEHANRLPVITMLDNRIAKLATDPTAVPSPGGGKVVQPGPDYPGKLSDATAPSTSPPRTSPPRTKVRTT